MGLHIGDGGSNVKLLYEDETYSVWDEKTSAYILLVIKPWHLSVGFYYGEWNQLRKIAADIELSETPRADPAVLYMDKRHIFCANDETISWHLRERQVTVSFELEDWEGFRTAVLTPDTIVWTVV